MAKEFTLGSEVPMGVRLGASRKGLIISPRRARTSLECLKNIKVAAEVGSFNPIRLVGNPEFILH